MLHTKKRILLLCMMVWVFMITVSGQSNFDITQLVADTKTFTFNDSKNTVKGFIYGELDEKTNCCGSDRIYLEVRIHPSGYVVEAKTLTGKNECFKSSAIDIVKNIKWEAKDFKGTKPVYFEIRPDINCEGGRDNAYKSVAIINNELLDENGKPKDPEAGSLIYLGDSDSEKPSENSATEATSVEEVADKENEEVSSSSEAPMENESAPVEVEVAEKLSDDSKEVVATENLKEEGSQVANELAERAKTEVETEATKVTAKPVETAKEMANKAEKTVQEKQPDPEKLLVSADTPGRRSMTEETVAVVDSPKVPAAEPVDPEAQAEKEAEIMVLKEQLDELRAQEEAIQQKQERRKEIMERRRQAQIERRRQLQAQKEAEAEGVNDPFAGEGETMDESSSQDPDQDDLDRLSQELSEIQNRKRELEDSRKRDAEELDQYIRDRVRLEEEIRRKEEEITRKREQQELDRLVEDRNRLEDDRRNLEGEMQRLMDEIQRLQDELSRKVGEIERQNQDIQRINATVAQREADINQQRMLREQQLAQELALMRQQADSESANLFRDPTDPGMPSVGINPNQLADTSLQARRIVSQIMQLQQQLQQIQSQGNPGGAPTPGVISPQISSGISGSTNLPEGSSRANEDRSWENIEYNAPEGTAPSTGSIGSGTSRASNSTGFDPVLGYSPDSSHSGTFENTAGPSFRSMQYGSGTNAMNRFLADQLKARGVCGLVAAFSEITVNGNGNVIDRRIIKANSTQAMINLPSIFNSMSFIPTYSEIPQRTNLSFEMNIPCGPGQLPAAGGVVPSTN